MSNRIRSTARDREERDDIRPAEHDDMLHWMQARGIKLTRANYLALAWLGIPPSPLDAEHEADLPSRFRKRVRQPRKRVR